MSQKFQKKVEKILSDQTNLEKFLELFPSNFGETVGNIERNF